MPEENIFAIFIDPLTDQGIVSLRALDAADTSILVVGAVGDTSEDERDVGEIAGVGQIGFAVEEEAALVSLLERVQADLVVDCAGDLCSTVGLLERCVKAHVAVLLWVAESGFDENELLELGKLDEVALEYSVPVSFFSDADELVRIAPEVHSLLPGIAPFQLY